MRYETLTVNIRGIRYAYTDTGGSGPAVLLVHGWPDDRSIWRHQLRYLASEGYRVVAIDWPAHGDSETPLSIARNHVAELGKDTTALLDQLGIEQAHLIAHDYGATVSWETVVNYPERFLSYCAISVGHSAEILKDIMRGNLFRYLWLILHGMPRLSRFLYLRRGAKRFHRKFASHQDKDRILTKLEEGRDLRFWTVWEQANPAAEVVYRQFIRGERKRTTPLPVLGVYSTRDEWMTEGQMKRSSLYTSENWQYERLEGGHWVQLEQPDQINAILGKWLGGRGAA